MTHFKAVLIMNRLARLGRTVRETGAAGPNAAELVKLRFLLGMTNEQAVQSLGISASTAKMEWTYAKCWLRAALLDSPPRG
jgi:predicted DNA-binding protein (UPF0251 family)